MSDVTITIGAQANEFNRNLEEAAELLRKFTGQSDLTGQQIKNNFGLAQRSVASFKDQVKLLEIEQRKANAGLREARAAVLEYNRTTEGTKINLKNAAKAFEELAKKEKDSTKGLTANQQKRKELLATLLRERGAVTNTKKALDNYRNGLNATTVASDRLRRANGDLIKSKGNLGSAFKRTLGFANQIAGVFGAGLGLYGAMRLFRGATKVIFDFDQQLKTLASISGATSLELDKLSRTAISVGMATRFSAMEVAGLMTELAKMGFAVQEIDAMTEGISKLATAANEELSPTAESVGNIIRAMGYQAEDTAHIVDVMALSFTQSALDLSRFRESMKYVSPLARSVGFSVENVSAVLAKLADAGVRGSMAGTSLRNVFMALSDESSELSQALGGGVTNFDDFINRMEELKETGIGAGEVFQLIDRRAVTALNTILDNTSSIRQLSEDMENANGSVDEMANIQMQSLSNRAEIAKNAWQGLILAIDKGDGVFSTMMRSTLTGFARTIEDITAGMNLQSEQMRQQLSVIQELERVTADSNTTMDERIKIIRRLNDEYPEMFKGMEIEERNWRNIELALDDAIEKKKAYLGIEFKNEDISNQGREINRLREDWENMDQSVRLLFESLDKNGNEFQKIAMQAINAKEGVKDLDTGVSDLNRTIGNTSVTLEQFYDALVNRRAIEQAEKDVKRIEAVTRDIFVAQIPADEGFLDKSFVEIVKNASDSYIDEMHKMAAAAMQSGDTRVQAYDKSLDGITDMINKEIAELEKRKEALETDLSMPMVPIFEEVGRTEESINYLIELRRIALEKVLEVMEETLKTSSDEIGERSNLLKLEQKIEETKARIATGDIALQERLAKIRKDYGILIANETLQGAERDKTLQLINLEYQEALKNIELDRIKEVSRREEDAFNRRITQLKSEMELAKTGGEGVSENPRVAAIEREMAVLNESYKLKEELRIEEENKEIKSLESQIKEKKALYFSDEQSRKDAVEEIQKQIDALKEKYRDEDIVAEREYVMELQELNQKLFEQKKLLYEEERDIAEKAAQWERDLAMYQAERVENLWQAMDLFGQTTKRIREQERKNEAEKLESQLREIEELKKINQLELDRLKTKLLTVEAESEHGIALRKQIEELQNSLNDLNLDETQLTEFLRRVLNPEMDMSEWQNFISAMKGVGNQLVGIYEGVLDERYRIAQEERALLDRRISEMQRDLDLELRLNEQGFASNVQALMAAIEQEKQARDKALQEEKKQAQEKRRLEQIMQTINLLTAVSNILKAESTKGLLGIATAAAGLGGLWMLWGSQANKAKSQTFEKGGSFLLDGPSHARGGVPLTPRHEAQGGELVSVFNRSATKKYGSQIKSMTDSINKGEYINPSVNSYNFDTTDIKAIRKLLEKESITYADGYKIIRKGNTTIRCRLN